MPSVHGRLHPSLRRPYLGECPLKPRVPGGILDSAVAVLAKREGAKPKHIGCWPGSSGIVATGEAAAVADWAVGKGLDGVVWTALPPKWNGETGCAPTTQEALAFLKAQGGDSAAAEYVRRAPKQIRTPLRLIIEKELGWTCTADA